MSAAGLFVRAAKNASAKCLGLLGSAVYRKGQVSNEALMALTGSAQISTAPKTAHPQRTGGLFDLLRTSTTDAHDALETALGLLDPPLSQARFAHILQGFLGFHRVWEPALDRVAALTALRFGRSRIAALEADLAALGLAPDEIRSAPDCPLAGRFGGSIELALGSLYVMEGSTLGGQVISRALAGAEWAPAGGLTYFNPYGQETGAMWRSFKTDAEALASPDRYAAIVQGAQACFTLLTDWLPARGAR